MPCPHNMEKPIDFWLLKGKAVEETKPTETNALARRKDVRDTESAASV